MGIGLLLLLRFLMLLTSAIIDMDNPQDPRTNLVLILVILSGLQMWAWPIGRGVCKKWYLDDLEASFILNLLVLIGGTCQITLSGGNQAALVYTSVGVAFATFIGIFAHSVKQGQLVRKSWRLVKVRFGVQKPSENEDGIENEVSLSARQSGPMHLFNS